MTAANDEEQASFSSIFAHHQPLKVLNNYGTIEELHEQIDLLLVTDER